MDEAQAGADSTAQSDIIARMAGGQGALTPREAARSLADTRAKDRSTDRAGFEGARDDATQDQVGAARAEETAAPAEPQSTERSGDDAAPEQDPGETEGADAEAPLPPIEPPRSWTKEDKELFRGLPRDTQLRLADRERSREGDFLRRQNEAAEKVKGLDARQQAADYARAQYEQALPTLLQALQEQQAGAFADVQSPADIDKMAREDVPRYVLWDAQQKKIAHVQQQLRAAQAQRAQEAVQHWATFVADEDARFRDKAPDLVDHDAFAKTARSAGDMLRELGFSDGELDGMWNGGRGISLRDHRIQLLIRDGVRFREAQAAAKKPAPRPVPQVQRPGPAPARNADADGRVKGLDQRLNATGNLRDAAALLAARRAARR